MVARPPLPPRFEVVREVGVGGTGRILEVIDRERGGARLAAKLLHPASAIDGERLRHELAVAAAVRHPNLVRLGELHELDGGWAMTLELVDGPALLDWVRRDHGDGSDDLVAWGVLESLLRPRYLEGRLRTALGQIAGALAALHGAGVVHRGLRPGNLRVDRADRVVVLDLAPATVAEARGRAAERGVIEYLAPEDAGGGRVTTASDLYGLGAVLYEIVTGRPPFVGAPADVAIDKVEQVAPRASRFVPELARDLDELCARLLERDPARRPSAADVAAQFGTPNQPRAGGIAPRPHRDHPPLGRDRELAALRAALAAPAPLCAVVSGPVGIGKTTLLDRIAREAARAGALVCVGTGERGKPHRFGAWDGLVDGVARYLAALTPVARAAVLPDDAGAIAWLSDSFARVVPARPSWGTLAELTARGLHALRALLHRLAAERHVVAIVDEDDGGGPELALLAALMEAPAPPLTIVLAADQRDAPALLAGLAALPIEVRSIPVEPLAEPDAIALAERLLGAGVPGAAVLAARAGGNPLALEQLAHSEHGGEPGAPGALTATRFAALSETARAIVRLIAAARGPVRQDVLGSALGLTHRVVSRELAHLSEARWLRSTGNRRNDLVELAHPVVAAAARAAGPLTTEHALLAAALDNSGLGDDDDRLHHWTHSGDVDRAGQLAIALVARARDSRDHAAAIARCDAVLALAPSPSLHAALVHARADARLGLGDLAGAGDDYLTAAAAADLLELPDEALDARRLAAEHLIRSGRVERGFAVASAAADAAGVELAMSPDRMIGKLMIERAKARLRGTALPPALDLAAARLADVCGSLAAAFTMIDMMRAAWFTSRGVRAALDSGDPRRIARALATDACVQVARGGPGVERARRALALAERMLDDEPRDRALRALLAASRGASGFLVGDFTGAVTLGDEAMRRYRACSPALAYEARAATLFVLPATAWLGRWRDTARRRAQVQREAAAAGDRHAEVFALTGYGVIAELAAGDDPGAIRERIAAATAAWPRDLAPAVMAREITALAVCDLYQGWPDAAASRLHDAWAALDEAYLLHVEHQRVTLLELSARAAIGCGALDGAGAAVRQLAEIGWAQGPARLLQASIAAHFGRLDQADELLAEGEAACERAGLTAHAVAAADRRARRSGDDTARAAAAARADGLGLGDLDRATAFLLPWPAPPDA